MSDEASSIADPPVWPETGHTHVPYALYNDPDIYRQERARIFQGPTWNYLALDCEIPNPGDYKATVVGDMPVIVVRTKDGTVNAFENRCAHRGALLCLEKFGNAKAFTCVYHAWSYDQAGKLVGVAFEKGVKGDGGMPPSFDRDDHNLRTLKTATRAGIVFGSFDHAAPLLDSYLGPDICSRMDRVMRRSEGGPVKVLGYNTQVLRNNWKLYAENTKDPYHASILHLFFTTFKVNRLTQKGGIIVSDNGGHHVSYSMIDRQHADDGYGQEKLRSDSSDFGLQEPALLDGEDEFGDGITLQILSVFPTLVLQQIRNSLVVRQIVPRGPDEAEVIWTHYGFEDDDDALTLHRMRQANMVGPAGYISMEDGAVGHFIQRALTGAAAEDRSLLLMGGEAAASQESRATETSIRGFWKAYRDLMGL